MIGDTSYEFRPYGERKREIKRKCVSKKGIHVCVFCSIAIFIYIALVRMNESKSFPVQVFFIGRSRNYEILMCVNESL
jgi:hypothetical protein